MEAGVAVALRLIISIHQLGSITAIDLQFGLFNSRQSREGKYHIEIQQISRIVNVNNAINVWGQSDEWIYRETVLATVRS